MAVLNSGLANLEQPADHLESTLLPGGGLKAGHDIPLPVLKAMKCDRRLFEHDAFGDDLFAQQGKQAPDNIDILGSKHHVGRIVMPIDGDTAQFQSDAGEHDKLHALHLNLPSEARFNLL